MKTTLDDFTRVGQEMIWRGSTLTQIEAFKRLGEALGAEPEVVGDHSSKSIKLPVVRYTLNSGAKVTLRDNFYDTNILFELDKPCTLSLEEFFDGFNPPLDWDWYMGEIASCRGYVWKKWLDSEMDDPNILTVTEGQFGYGTCDQEVKDRWIKRMSDPEWYSEDWSSACLTWDGEFGPGVKIFRQRRAFAEGIDTRGAMNFYALGAKKFILAVRDLIHAETLIKRVEAEQLSRSGSELKTYQVTRETAIELIRSALLLPKRREKLSDREIEDVLVALYDDKFVSEGRDARIIDAIESGAPHIEFGLDGLVFLS